jgi:hypothetical protein
MYFDFKAFIRFTYLWFSETSWTTRRIAILLAFYLIFPLLELAIRIGFFCDDIFFRDHRKESIDGPVFIIGNPRSGTTFLHRLLSKDVERFSTMRMWEILFAPSITLRRGIKACGALLERMGFSLNKRLERIERGWHEQAVMHKVSLTEPEEDDYLLLHIWSALTTGLSAGLLKEAIPYTFFDMALRKEKKHRIMAFYKKCIQRHLHANQCDQNTRRHYLAKNPALCPKIDTLLEELPGAKIIYLVRNPLEMFPSYLSMMAFSWQILGIPIDDTKLRDYILEMSRHWYRYPLERLKEAPEESYVIIRYNDLVNDPEGTVATLYRRFGFQISPYFAQVLREEAAKARLFRSRHRYLLDETGLSRDQIVSYYREVFERFRFDTSEPGSSRRELSEPTGIDLPNTASEPGLCPGPDRFSRGERP